MIAARRSETTNGAFMKRNDDNQRRFCCGFTPIFPQSGCLLHLCGCFLSARTEGLIFVGQKQFPL